MKQYALRSAPIILLIVVFGTIALYHLSNRLDTPTPERTFRVERGLTKPEPGKEPWLFIYAIPSRWIWFLGDSVNFVFVLANQDSATSLVLEGFPRIDRGVWDGGEIRVDNPGFRKRIQSEPAMTMKPIALVPGKALRGAFELGEFGEITAPGGEHIQLVLNVTDSAGRKRQVLSNKQSLKVAPVPRSIRNYEEKPIRAVVYALQAYCCDQNLYPPNRREMPIPRLPLALTTPVAYLRPEQVKAAENLAVLIIGSSGYCVAGQGPDRRWDVLPAIKGTDWEKLDGEAATHWLDSLIPYSYDPTNGTNSSGDQILLSTFMSLPATEQTKY